MAEARPNWGTGSGSRASANQLQQLNQAMRHRAACRDNRRLHRSRVPEQEFADRGPDPSEVVAQEELVREFHQRLSADERRLVEDRSQGRSWRAIAADLGCSPNAVRMRLERALDRVARELRLDL